MHLPKNFVQGLLLPLVLNFHGLTSSAAMQQTYTQFDKISDTANVVVVYPNGTPWTGGGNGWNSGVGVNSNVDDVGFVSALIDTIYRDFGIDRERVYAIGFSNGGFLSHRLACELSEKIAAIGPVGGTIGTYTTKIDCNPKRPVPVMHIHGTNDTVVLYNGSNFGTSVDSAINFWVGKNRCSTTPVSTELPDKNKSDGSTVTKYVYGNGADSSEVVLLKINSAGHTWPGSIGLSNTNMDISASSELWNFIKKYRLHMGIPIINYPKQSPKNVITTKFDRAFKKLAIFTKKSVFLKVALYDTHGKQLFESYPTQNTPSASRVDITYSDIPAGIYLLVVITKQEKAATTLLLE